MCVGLCADDAFEVSYFYFYFYFLFFCTALGGCTCFETRFVSYLLLSLSLSLLLLFLFSSSFFLSFFFFLIQLSTTMIMQNNFGFRCYTELEPLDRLYFSHKNPIIITVKTHMKRQSLQKNECFHQANLFCKLCSGHNTISTKWFVGKGVNKRNCGQPSVAPLMWLRPQTVRWTYFP